MPIPLTINRIRRSGWGGLSCEADPFAKERLGDEFFELADTAVDRLQEAAAEAAHFDLGEVTDGRGIWSVLRFAVSCSSEVRPALSKPYAHLGEPPNERSNFELQVAFFISRHRRAGRFQAVEPLCNDGEKLMPTVIAITSLRKQLS